jgi:hypothetical protein
MKNREGQVWCEMSVLDSPSLIGIIIRSRKVQDWTCHDLVIIDSIHGREGDTITWNEDECTGTWDTYNGLRRVS